jgi:hypothetical protein
MRFSLLTCTLLTCTGGLIAAPALAADLGTYRPGTPYHSVIVPTANVCESQCDGDAQCRGWNYVKAAPQAPGVCEFQSSVSQPISSAISISGISNTARPMSARVVEGNTNTIRVGTAVAPQAAGPQAPQSQTTGSGRQIIRQAVPAQDSGAYAAPRPAFRPALDGYTAQPQQMTRPATSRGPARQSPQMRQTPPSRGQVATRPTYEQPQYAPSQSLQNPQSYQGRPPIGQPIAPMPRGQNQTFGQVNVPPMIQAPAQMPARTAPQGEGRPQAYVPPQSYTQPATYAAPQTYQAQPQSAQPQSAQPQSAQSRPAQPMPRSSASHPISWDSIRAQPAQAQPGLYGRLNDDVRQSSTMPTVPSYPTEPVTETPLAGAQPW